MNGLRPHDLVWPAAAEALAFDGDRPAWATADWLASAPVVVRRDRDAAGRVPVGVRGTMRRERAAAWLAADAVARIATPEALAAEAVRTPGAGRSPLAVACRRLAIMEAGARAVADRLGVAIPVWGVTGATGFALATGLDILRPDSDLDVLVRSTGPQDAAWLRALPAAWADPGADAPLRLDVQVNLAGGAFALAEWLRAPPNILLKTDAGPLLCADPWRPGETR